MALADHREMLAAVNQRLHEGETLIKTGAFSQLRERTGMSKRHQAEILGISGPTLTAWEAGTKRPVRKSLLRVNDGYRQMVSMIKAAEDAGVDWTTSIPLSQAAMILGLRREVILRRCDDGELECFDLGLLGIWVQVGAETTARCRATKAGREQRIAGINQARKEEGA